MSESSIRKLTEFVFDQILHLKDEIDNNKNRKLFSRCLGKHFMDINILFTNFFSFICIATYRKSTK